jgi:hypothetical protein
MEPKGSSPHSQELSTCPYTEENKKIYTVEPLITDTLINEHLQ